MAREKNYQNCKMNTLCFHIYVYLTLLLKKKKKTCSVYSGWVMLGKPLPDPVKSYTALGFQGYLSKVQIWGRALDVTNEIQKQVR